MLNKRVNISKACSKAEYLHIIHNFSNSVYSAFNINTHHAAIAVMHLFFSYFMCRVAFKARIVNSVYFWMFLKELSYFHSI